MQKTISITINEFDEYKEIDCDLALESDNENIWFEIESLWDTIEDIPIDPETLEWDKMALINKLIQVEIDENAEQLIEEINQWAKDRHEDLQLSIRKGQ